jgi:shikimate dehydrogenase
MFYSALIGKPTKHSVSHVMYEMLAKAAHIDDPYKHIKIDVVEEELPKILLAFKELKFVGLNVTLPHKLAVINYIDDVDKDVIELGAVNTIKISNRIKGYNTDWLGIVTPIKRIVGKQKIENVTIFGTGGAARAAIYAAKNLGAKSIFVFFRDDKNDEKLQGIKNDEKKLVINLHNYSELNSYINKSQLIINATSAGMIGNDPLPFDINLISKINFNNKIFFDVVFNPLRTPLIDYFEKQGAITIDGLWMMIYQGIASLSIWLDQEITITRKCLEKIHKDLKKELNNV